jgi:hypothetical protein
VGFVDSLFWVHFCCWRCKYQVRGRLEGGVEIYVVGLGIGDSWILNGVWSFGGSISGDFLRNE